MATNWLYKCVPIGGVGSSLATADAAGAQVATQHCRHVGTPATGTAINICRAGKSKHAQFWQAHAAMTCSRAYLQGVNPCTQPLPTQTGMRLEAAWFAALATELATNVKRQDTLRAAVQCAWNACCGGCDYPALRAAFVDPLTHVCAAARRGSEGAAPLDPALDARINALLCACLLSAGRPEDACAHARAWQKPPAHDAHANVWGWLFEIARVPQVDVAVVASKLGIYTRAFQAPQWLAAARAAGGREEQFKALERACQVAAVSPALAAEAQLACMEWLLSSGTAASSEAQVASRLATAVSALVGKEAGSAPSVDATYTLGEVARRRSRASSASSTCSALSHSCIAGGRGNGPVVSTLQLVQQMLEDGQLEGVAQLDAAMRACVLASLAAGDTMTRLAWLMCAHTCAAQMAASAVHLVWLDEAAAVARAQAEGESQAGEVPLDSGERARPADSGADEGGEALPQQQSPAFPAAPHSLWGWLELSLTQAQLAALMRGGARVAQHSGLDVTKDTVPWPERTLAWLACLAQQLECCGCTAHRVPVHWLQAVVASRLIGGLAGRGFVAQLSATLEGLGFTGEAELYSQNTGVYLHPNPGSIVCLCAGVFW